MDEGDTETVSKLISQSIVTILKAGLTSHQRQNLAYLKENHRVEIEELISSAFHRRWLRDGQPNLSNAMDEVLKAVQFRIREARDIGECL
jgi:hypothetical protein